MKKKRFKKICHQIAAVAMAISNDTKYRCLCSNSSRWSKEQLLRSSWKNDK